MSGSSSKGSRLGSMKARGNLARNSGTPSAGAPPNSSSTKQSSDRRKSWALNGEAATNAAGYSVPLCGEASTSGALWRSGRRISWWSDACMRTLFARFITDQM